MSWIGRQIQKLRVAIAKRAIKYAGIPLRDPALIELFGMRGATQSGLYVDESNAHTYAAYYRAVSLIATSIAMVDFAPFKQDDVNGTTPDTTHVTNQFFRIAPNMNMSWFQFCEMLTSYAITWGNGYAHIERDQGVPVAMWPLMPNQVTPGYDEEDGRVLYLFKAKYPGEEDATYEADEILHITGFGFDGLQGYSVVTCARETIALGLSTERFGASFFGNNAVPGGIITHPAELTEIAKKNIESEVTDVTGGSIRARKVVVLDEGMKYQQIGVPPEDGQFLETRKFQVREISRWTGVPPHMLFDLDEANFSTTESQGLDFLIYTLSPWLRRWLAEMTRKLLTPIEQRFTIFKADVSQIVVMDTNTKWDVYGKKRNMGYITLNDIAAMEKDKKLPKEVGDSRVTPSTMIPLGEERATPILPQTISDTIDLLKSMNSPNMITAKEVINATMPQAETKFVVALCNQLASQGVIKNAADTQQP